MKRISVFSIPIVNIYQLILCVILVLSNLISFAQLTSFWSLGGNSLISGQFLGTTNNEPLIFKTDSIERVRITPQGNFGVGITTPKYILHVHDNRLLTFGTDNQIEQNTMTSKGLEKFYAYSAFQLTNNKTGISEKDGLLFYTNDNNGGIHLQEQGNFELRTGNSLVTLYPDNKCSFLVLV